MSRVSAAFVTHLPEIQPEVMTILFSQIAWFGPNTLQPNNITKKKKIKNHLISTHLWRQSCIRKLLFSRAVTRHLRLGSIGFITLLSGRMMRVRLWQSRHTQRSTSRRFSTARPPGGDLTSRRLQPMRREKRLPLSAAETPGRKWFINKVCQMIKINIMSRLVTYVPVTLCEDWNHDCAFYNDESHQRVASSHILTNSLLRKQHI